MKCNVCNGICEKDVMHGSYIYWKCLSCFTSQVLPQPTSNELKQYYDTFHLSNELGGIYDEVEFRMKSDFATKVSRVFSFTKRTNPKLLDVGCGKGFFIKEALSHNIEAEGIDMSISGVQYAIDMLGVKATVGQIEDLCSNDFHSKFDVVTFWATIEHLSIPLSTLIAIYECLKPGGILLLDTGLGNTLWEKHLTGHSQWYDAPQHLFVFSIEGLRILLAEAGFTIVDYDENFERSKTRKWLKAFRCYLLCSVSYIFLTPLLGKKGLLKMKQEAKWPLGQLISIVAIKN